MEETEVNSVVCKGRGCVASLILGKCHQRSQWNKGEIKVQGTQGRGLGEEARQPHRSQRKEPGSKA